MSSTSSSTSGSEEGSAFDYDDADITIRSSDQVDFRVHKIILSTSSPFFKSMFSLPQPDSSKHHPIVDMPEDSTTIKSLLTFIYPIVSKSPRFDSLDNIMDAFSAAKKYEMAAASQCLIKQFGESKFITNDPVVAFCAAYSRKLEDAARIAAKASLKHPMNLNEMADKLQYVDGVAFHHLYKFHRACSTAAAEAVSGMHFNWISKSRSTWWDLANRRCTSKCSTYSYSLKDGYISTEPNWEASSPYHNFITRAHNVLLEHPCREAVTKYSFLEPFYKEKVCDSCKLTLRGLPEFSGLLGQAVERRVSMVDLELPF